ncbi:MAG: type III-B CRISPR module-associated protein Cmr5 [Acidobacteriia bacterium]|nr:type III-B CRISPR module-associated protein Cmr5 [Methyloceanibacter sp.]MCL6490837.1 type III-B CRISPR module-associated protein Cmr5 [Terriglobia bacterium]
MDRTISQKMAQAAYERIVARKPDREFASFARSFPSLIHASGLAQAVAFARAKNRDAYLEDLAAVLAAAGHSDVATVGELETTTRNISVPAYIRLSRNALQAAGWLKRYVEAREPE